MTRTVKHSAVKKWVAGIGLMQSVAVTALEKLEEIPIAYALVAKAYEVPADILYAVALAESGKPYKATYRPWPWALNIDGQSFYCHSEQEAARRIGAALQHKQAIDIGLMQISWYWHRQRFASPAEALVPIHNLKVGAAILREQYEQTGDWWRAVGRYHDPGRDERSLDNAKRYRERVERHWREQFQ